MWDLAVQYASYKGFTGDTRNCTLVFDPARRRAGEQLIWDLHRDFPTNGAPLSLELTARAVAYILHHWPVQLPAHFVACVAQFCATHDTQKAQVHITRTQCLLLTNCSGYVEILLEFDRDAGPSAFKDAWNEYLEQGVPAPLLASQEPAYTRAQLADVLFVSPIAQTGVDRAPVPLASLPVEDALMPGGTTILADAEVEPYIPPNYGELMEILFASSDYAPPPDTTTFITTLRPGINNNLVVGLFLTIITRMLSNMKARHAVVIRVGEELARLGNSIRVNTMEDPSAIEFQRLYNSFMQLDDNHAFDIPADYFNADERLLL